MDQVRHVVKALMRYGPKYTVISKVTGVPITTVRYIIRRKLLELGFTLRIAIDYSKLGLQWYLVELKPTLPPNYFLEILELFGNSMYLRYYTYLLNSKKFLTFFSIPPKFENDFISFFNKLVKLNLLKEYNCKKLSYRRVVPLRVDCFDFENGVWMQDWDKKPRDEEIPEVFEEPNQISGLTSLDLKILAELYRNSFANYTDIAKKLNVARQTVKRHYEKILQVIYLYMLFWMPINTPEHVCIPIFLQTNSSVNARKTVLNIPFTHLEMRDEDSQFYSLLFAPSIGFYKVLKYLNEKRLIEQIDFLDFENTMGFFPPYNLFKDKKGWINVFEEVLQKILREIRVI